MTGQPSGWRGQILFTGGGEGAGPPGPLLAPALVQNVCLQRRHRLTDDASTRRWRGSQQTGSVCTTR